MRKPDGPCFGGLLWKSELSPSLSVYLTAMTVAAFLIIGIAFLVIRARYS